MTPDDLLSELRVRHDQQAEAARAALAAMNELSAAIQAILAVRQGASTEVLDSSLPRSTERVAKYVPGQSRISKVKRRGDVAGAVLRAVQARRRHVKHIRAHALEHSGLSLSAQSVSNALQRLFERGYVRQVPNEGWMTWAEAQVHITANLGSTLEMLQRSVDSIEESNPRPLPPADTATEQVSDVRQAPTAQPEPLVQGSGEAMPQMFQQAEAR